MIDISELPDLSTATPEYVKGLVEERYSDLARLPPQAREILRSCTGRILDVGPGEGVSSMALARFAEKATVLGVEMDQKHLAVAWPLCRGHRNLQLKWAVFGNPSNRRIVNDGPLAPSAPIIECSCTHLFSWLGMSRGLIFAPDSESDWSGVVSEACVLVYPAFWR